MFSKILLMELRITHIKLFCFYLKTKVKTLKDYLMVTSLVTDLKNLKLFNTELSTDTIKRLKTISHK